MSDILFPSIDTPALIVDLDKLEANIKEMAIIAAVAGVKLRPHTKIHECIDIAKLQIGAGACGISVAKLAEAERMAEGGIENILVIHPFYGKHKLEMLKGLLINKPKLRLTVVVDMIEQARGISQLGRSVGKKVPVLLKIDTGIKRFGCPLGEPTLNLAMGLQQLSGIKFMGIITHELAIGARTADEVDMIAYEVASVMTATARMLRREGITVKEVCVGASPTVRSTCRYIKSFPEITEIHPGAYVVGDMTYVNAFAMTEDACAITVLTTVISTATPGQVVIDAGVKTFGADSLIGLRWKPDYFFRGSPRYGFVKGRPDLWLARLSAEVGIIYLMDVSKKINIGERLEIIPNNAALAINLHDEIYGMRNGVVERVIPVTGRGKGN